MLRFGPQKERGEVGEWAFACRGGGERALGERLMVVPALEVLIASVSFCGILAAWALSQVSTGDIDTLKASRTRKDGTETIGVDVEALLDEVQAKMNLPRAQLKMYWNSFSRYDVDGSGSVDANGGSPPLCI